MATRFLRFLFQFQKAITSLVFLFILSSSFGQLRVQYSQFSVFKNHETVQIHFILNSGSTCYGINIERGTDTNHFESIGNFPGSCGSPVEPTPYQFVDEAPVYNQRNYYRIHFGGSDYSHIESLMMPLLTANIYPLPFKDYFWVYLLNKTNETRIFELSDAMGQTVSIQNSDSSNIAFNIPHLAAGIYCLQIRKFENKQLIISKLIIIE